MADPKDKPEKQESLPFPPTPSASIAGRTMQELVYKQRVTPRRLPADAPNILIVLIDDAGPALPATFGGEVETPTMDRIVSEGIAYNRVPYNGHVLADPSVAADRPQSPPGRERADRGVRQRLGWLFRKDFKEQRLGGRGAERISVLSP